MNARRCGGGTGKPARTVTAAENESRRRAGAWPPAGGKGDLLGGVEQAELEVLLARAGAVAARQLGLVLGEEGLELGLAGQQRALQLLQPLAQQRRFVLAVAELGRDALGLAWGRAMAGSAAERGGKERGLCTGCLQMFAAGCNVSAKSGCKLIRTNWRMGHLQGFCALTFEWYLPSSPSQGRPSS